MTHTELRSADMRTLALISVLLTVSLQSCLAKDRVYYIGAVDVLWDYAPAGKNLRNGKPIDSDP